MVGYLVDCYFLSAGTAESAVKWVHSDRHLYFQNSMHWMKIMYVAMRL